MDSKSEKANWWRENELLREQMDLPPYQPSKFLDNVYTHKIINQMEKKHGIEILLVGRNTRYGDDWEIQVNGQQVCTIGRHRDNNSNTVYELESKEFQEIVESSLACSDSSESCALQEKQNQC